MRTQSGFTLIELLIVTAIIGILSTVGYGSYSSHITTSRRADGIARIHQVAQAQEKYYLENNSYASNINELGVKAESRDGHYVISTSSSNRNFSVLAIPKNNSPQKSDSSSQRIKLYSKGKKRPAAWWN